MKLPACFCALALALLGCSTGTETVTTDLLPGIYHGSIKAFNELSDSTSASGFTISAEELQTAVLTDERGFFDLPIRTGTSTIRISKVGFGTVHTGAISFLGGGTLYAKESIAQLYKRPSIYVTQILPFSTLNTDNILANYKLSSLQVPRNFMIKLRLFRQRPENSTTPPDFEVIQWPMQQVNDSDTLAMCYSPAFSGSTPLPVSHGSMAYVQAAVLNGFGYRASINDSLINDTEGPWSNIFKLRIP